MIKFDIENKILIPFMILSIIPITILGIISFWNGYQLLLNDQTANLESSLSEAMAYIEIMDEDVENYTITLNQAKTKARKYFEAIEKRNLIILDGNEFVLNNSNLDTNNLKQILQNTNNEIYNNKNLLYIYDKYERWDWTIILGLDKTVFLDELLEIQKYLLLIAIIFLVISMQSIIFIAHSISKPIKNFAEMCKTIELSNLKDKIKINRSDEIGILANSFNSMIDELNTSTEKLIEMKKFNEDILKNISIGIMTTDENGTLLSINEAGKEILNKYNHNDEIYSELNKQIIATILERKSINTVITFPTIVNGKTIYFDVSTSLLKLENNDMSGAICSFNDITRRKTLENNIVRVDRLASVGQFAAGLAHEIRNPLTGIKTSIQVIKNRLLPKNDPSSVELIDGVTYEIDRINNLVTELLDFSKPKKSNHKKENIIDILKKSLDLTIESMNRKKINTHLDIHCHDAYVLVDKGQAEQIFINIITNAIDAMDNQGQFSITIENTFIEQCPFVLIVFTDNGTGMDKEITKKVFDPFFTTKSKGTGLGLSVVSKLVEENNGKIEIESIENVGTKVKIYLPLYIGEKNEN